MYALTALTPAVTDPHTSTLGARGGGSNAPIAEPMEPPAISGQAMLSRPKARSALHSNPLYTPKKAEKLSADTKLYRRLLASNDVFDGTDLGAPKLSTGPNAPQSRPTNAPRITPSAVRASHGT